jgi:hypothetical protein
MKYRMLAEAYDELRAAAEYYDDHRAGLGTSFWTLLQRGWSTS